MIGNQRSIIIVDNKLTEQELAKEETPRFAFAERHSV